MLNFASNILNRVTKTSMWTLTKSAEAVIIKCDFLEVCAWKLITSTKERRFGIYKF